MIEKENIIKVWCIAGIFVITILGSVVHYIYPWSGKLKIMGMMFPVNESVWEHLKLGYWALVLFSIPEYIFIGRWVNNYFLSKLTGIIALELTVLIVFYGYFLITRKSMFWINIASFVLGATACQLSVYRIFMFEKVTRQIEVISLICFMAIGILFAILTFYPPRYGIFKDIRDNIYGIHRGY